MYLIYVDESGDAGLAGSPTRYFALSGLVVHELRWHACLEGLIGFRRALRNRFGFKLREEFHTARLISRPGSLAHRIKRHHRLEMIRLYADAVASMTDLSVINILVDKQGKPSDYDVFGMAWRVLIQRFENTLRHRNFPGPQNPDERGILFCDHTDDKKLITLMRQMRRFNPIPNRAAGGYTNRPLLTLIDDPNFRDSEHSLFIQTADMAAYLLYQWESPNSYMRKRSGRNFLRRLAPVLCTHASTSDPFGIVRI